MDEKYKLNHEYFTIKSGEYRKLSSIDTSYTEQISGKKESKKALDEDIGRLSRAQELLWSSKQFSVLIILQAMDAAGKDGTIKHVMSGVNPQGCDVFSFKAPSDEERLHHFLWRPGRFLPPRGKMAIFNRSYYEEVLVVRVHPEMLDKGWLPVHKKNVSLEEVWESRFEEIREFETRITKNGILVLKFFLHISKEEQLKRFLKRLNRKDKQWKFSVSDYEERSYWDQYQDAYEKMLNATSTENAPWYVIPADNKWYSRAVVADIIASKIYELDLKLPEVSEEQLNRLQQVKEEFEKELQSKAGS